MNLGQILGILLLIYVVLTIIELIGLHRFKLQFYNKGFKIFRKEIAIKFSNWNYLDGIYSEKEGNYVFIPEMKVGYFVTRMRYYRRYSLFAFSRGIPLTIFGQFIERENKLEIIYFISYRLVVLIFLWLVTWIVLPIMTWNLIGIGVGIGGILFTLFFIYLANMFQQGKMLIISDEISKILKIRK